MTNCTNRLNTILTPFYRLISRLEFELTGYVVLHKLLCFVFAVIGGSLDIDAVTKMLFHEQYRASFLFLISERSQASGIDKRAFLGEVVAEVGEDSALLVLHVARNPEIFFEPDFFIPPHVLVIPHAVGTSGDHLRK